MTALLIFLVIILLFIWDRFPPSIVALAGCAALVVSGVSTTQDAFAGFTNDIVWIVFGTEIFGIAYQESGLAGQTARFIKGKSGSGASYKRTRRIIILAGLIAAFLSAFLNNQVVCALMLTICVSLSREMKDLDVRHILLPIIYLAILGGQLTLVGAPATLAAASIAEDMTGYQMSMFELLPMGSVILLFGFAFICICGTRISEALWKSSDTEGISNSGNNSEKNISDTNVSNELPVKKKEAVTVFAGAVLLFLLLTEIVSVGAASVIAGIICIFGNAVNTRTVFQKIDWNIFLWLGGSIGIANALNQSGMVQQLCEEMIQILPENISPYLLLGAVVLLTTLISNVIANTTTVLMILPMVLTLAAAYGFNPEPFIIAVTMAAGLSILTPLSSGFIGMTMRVGYRFRDYIRYGWPVQLLLSVLVILLSCNMYSFYK